MNNLALSLCTLLVSSILLLSSPYAQPSSPNNTPPEPAAKLAYTYKAPKGYTYALRIEQTSDLSLASKTPTKVKTNLATTMRVERSDRTTKPGVIPLTYSFTNLVAKINANGKPLPVGAFDQVLRRIRVEQLVDASGKELEFIIGPTSPRREQSLRLLRDLFLRTLPTFDQAKPVTPGSTWTRTESSLPESKDKILDTNIKQVFKLEKIETVQGRLVAFISSTMTLTSKTEPNAKRIGAPSTGTGQGTTLTLFDLEKGVVQSHEIDMTSTTQAGGEHAGKSYTMRFKADMMLKE